MVCIILLLYIYNSKKEIILKPKKMTTILTTEKNGFTYKIEFNGSKTYFVSTKFGCEGHFSSLRKAQNFINKL